MSEPLIYTIDGNIPASELECKTFRSDSPKEIVLCKEWFRGERMVRRDVDVLPLFTKPTFWQRLKAWLVSGKSVVLSGSEMGAQQGVL